MLFPGGSNYADKAIADEDSIGASPLSTWGADLNLDGHWDLIATEGGGDNTGVHIFLGDGAFIGWGGRLLTHKVLKKEGRFEIQAGRIEIDPDGSVGPAATGSPGSLSGRRKASSTRSNHGTRYCIAQTARTGAVHWPQTSTRSSSWLRRSRRTMPS